MSRAQVLLDFLNTEYDAKIQAARERNAERLEAVLAAQKRQLKLFADTLHRAAWVAGPPGYGQGDITLPLNPSCLTSIDALSHAMEISCVDVVQMAVFLLEAAFDHGVLQQNVDQFVLLGVTQHGVVVTLKDRLHTAA